MTRAAMLFALNNATIVTQLIRGSGEGEIEVIMLGPRLHMLRD